MRRLVFLLLLLLGSPYFCASADYYFDYNTTCAEAYKAYMALRVEEGDALIRRELFEKPYNLTATFISDYGDCLRLLFNGNPKELKERAAHQEERLSRLAKAGNAEPWKRLALAGVHLHWALIHMRQGAQFKAAAGFRRSYLLLRENAERFPDFAEDDVLYGAEEALAGIIPDSYKWLANVLGMKGDFNRGLSRLSAYLKSRPDADAPFHEEALIFDTYLRYLYGGERKAAWQQINSDRYFPVAGNLMRSFIRGNLAISSRRADIAISTLRAAETLPGSNNWPVFDLELGSALLLRLDEGCVGYLERYVARNKGRLFTKDALQQAALAAFLSGDMQRAVTLRHRILSEGNMLTDADKQAQRFAEGGKWPDPLLLAARLLIDGGYAGEALRKLRSSNVSAFSDVVDQLEYDFRLGRALEETGDAAAAVQAYQRVINKGRERPEYFAARAALQMAGIYESRGQLTEAMRYYREALSMRDHDFQASIDQQAKAGLARLER
jgi:tetratricopeptide (TPR) repeat protein